MGGITGMCCQTPNGHVESAQKLVIDIGGPFWHAWFLITVKGFREVNHHVTPVNSDAGRDSDAGPKSSFLIL